MAKLIPNVYHNARENDLGATLIPELKLPCVELNAHPWITFLFWFSTDQNVAPLLEENRGEIQVPMKSIE